MKRGVSQLWLMPFYSVLERIEMKKNNTLYKCRCRWCDEEKAASKFFKCSIDNKTLICNDCINQKYKEILQKSDKAKALLVCCHHLNVPFVYDIFNSLNVSDGLGIYIRQLNLTQNYQNGTFEDGLVKYVDLNIFPKETARNEAKTEILNTIKQLEEMISGL